MLRAISKILRKSRLFIDAPLMVKDGPVSIVTCKIHDRVGDWGGLRAAQVKR